MAEVPDEAIWIVVGAIVVEGIALALITYFIWRSYQKKADAQQPAPAQDAPEGASEKK